MVHYLETQTCTAVAYHESLIDEMSTDSVNGTWVVTRHMSTPETDQSPKLQP